MAAVSDILSFARAQAKTDSNGLTNANGLIFVNEAQSDFHLDLINRGVDASQLQEAHRDGTVNTGTYLYPTDMFFLKSMELNYANTNAQDYKRADQVDVSNLQGGVSFGWLRTNASKNAPQFDDRGDWYEIFPTPTSSDNVTQLIRMFYYIKPTDYTAVSDTLAYPVSLDYRILGWRVVSIYLDSLEVGRGDKANAVYQQKLDKLTATLSRGSQQPIRSSRLPLDGFEF